MMANKTADGLIEHAKSLLTGPYMWGTYGKKITDALIDEKVKQYPAQYTAAYVRKLRGLVGSGKRAVDCVGLIKAYMMTEAPGGDPVYQADYDKNVVGMRGACSPLEGIATLPEIPGLLVFIGTTHVGIYLGDGQVIEAEGSDCVKITAFKSKKWSDWGKLRWVTYPAVAKAESKLPETQAFTNTTGSDLAVHSNTTLSQRVGTLPAGNNCHTLGAVNGKTLLLYRISGTTEYKVGFVCA
jgi:hypothetical protein